MKKRFLISTFLMMAGPVMAGGTIEPCENELDTIGTTINGVDTTEWLSVSGFTWADSSSQVDRSLPMGLGCDVVVNVNENASSGDHAYVYDAIEPDPNADPLTTVLKYEFELELSNLVNSYQDGDGVVFFQVRSNNPNNTRLLNVSLFRYRLVDDQNPYSQFKDGWELKLAWFKPQKPTDGGKPFVKEVKWFDLGIQPEEGDFRSVRIRYEWTIFGSKLIIDGVEVENPFTLPYTPEYVPVHTRLGYMYTSTPLKTLDELRFMKVVPHN